MVKQTLVQKASSTQRAFKKTNKKPHRADIITPTFGRLFCFKLHHPSCIELHVYIKAL